MSELKDKVKPINSASAKELDKIGKQFDEFDKQVKDLTLDRMNVAPKEETEQQTKMSQREINDSKDIYLKPHKIISSREKFNERYRDDYNFQKEYVNFIAENKEVIGESIDIWTKPFAGVPAEEWIVPTNKPVWGPRYLAEQIRKCTYHRLVMQEHIATETMGMGTMYGRMAVDTVIQRLDANPVIKKKSIFMGKEAFS